MKFTSENGSTVEVSGTHQGIFTIDYDWFEECGCPEAEPDFNGDMANPEIIAYCDCHDPHRVKLFPSSHGEIW